MRLKTHIFCSFVVSGAVYKIDTFGREVWWYSQTIYYSRLFGVNYPINLVSFLAFMLLTIPLPNLIIDLFGHRGNKRDKILHGLFTSPIIMGFLSYILIYILNKYYLPEAIYWPIFVFYFVGNTFLHLFLDSLSYQGVYLFHGWWLSLTDRPSNDRLLNNACIAFCLIIIAMYIIIGFGISMSNIPKTPP